MLGSSCAVGGGFLAIALVEAIDASCGIDQLLFSRKERVAGRTDFDVQVTFLGGASFEGLAARAGDVDFDVFWMNSWFHLITLYRRRPGRDFKRDIVAETGCFTQRHKERTQRHKARRQFWCLCVFTLCLCVKTSSRSAPKTRHPHTLELLYLPPQVRAASMPGNSKSHQPQRPDSGARVS